MMQDNDKRGQAISISPTRQGEGYSRVDVTATPRRRKALALPGGACRAATAARHARHRGVVLYLMLFAFLLLAGMVMFVINLGRQNTRRIDLQHAADATAVAASGWVARSFNTVALNNINMARAICLVNIIDSMPDATRFTKQEHEAVLEALANTSGVTDSWVRDQISDMEQELRDELNILIPMLNYFDSYDVRNLTFYDGPGGRGEFWRAMEGMDLLSQATMANLTDLTQLNATAGREANTRRLPGQSDAILVRLSEEIPWKRGKFDDFARPVMQGLLPDEVDNVVTNRGPFDAVYGWRQIQGSEAIGYWVSDGPTGPPLGGSRGSVPIGSGAGGGGGASRHFVQTGRTDPDSYSVYGFRPWLIGKVGHFASNHLPHGRFTWWHNRLEQIKVGYLWPGTVAKFVIDPQFITDFDQAVAEAENNRSNIKETWFLAIEMKSKYPRGGGGFLTPGTYSFYVHNGQDDRNTPRTVRLNGWSDPRTWNAPKIADHAWRDEWEYQLYYDPAIGIQPQYDAAGQLVPQTAYRIDTFIFLGINVGPQYEVRNPHNFSGRGDLPAPTDLDHARIGYSRTMARYDALNFLVAVQVDDRAIAWPSRFSGNKPYPHQMAIAQAHVFNNHSWDLWTQMWEAQVKPVEGIDRWLDALAASPPTGSTTSTETITKMTDYLRAARDVIAVMSEQLPPPGSIPGPYPQPEK